MRCNATQALSVTLFAQMQDQVGPAHRLGSPGVGLVVEVDVYHMGTAMTDSLSSRSTHDEIPRSES